MLTYHPSSIFYGVFEVFLRFFRGVSARGFCEKSGKMLFFGFLSPWRRGSAWIGFLIRWLNDVRTVDKIEGQDLNGCLPAIFRCENFKVNCLSLILEIFRNSTFLRMVRKCNFLSFSKKPVQKRANAWIAWQGRGVEVNFPKNSQKKLSENSSSSCECSFIFSIVSPIVFCMSGWQTIVKPYEIARQQLLCGTALVPLTNEQSKCQQALLLTMIPFYSRRQILAKNHLHLQLDFEQLNRWILACLLYLTSLPKNN